MVEDVYKLPTALSLGVVAGILTLSILLSLAKTAQQRGRPQLN